MTTPSIDCGVCKSTGSMGPATMSRNGGIALAIGFVIVGVATVSLLVSVVFPLVGLADRWGQDWTSKVFVAFLLLFVAAVGGMLAAKRKVLRCGVCGVVLERS